MRVRCYDNGGKTFDRYTIVFLKPWSHRGRRIYPYLAASDHPFHPQGFGQHGESVDRPIDEPNGKHLGTRVSRLQLPPDVQRFIAQEVY